MSDICSTSAYAMTVEEDAAVVIARQQAEIEQLKKELRKTKRALDKSLDEYTDLEYVLDKKINEINHIKENGNPDRARHQGDNFRLRARMRQCPVCSQLPRI